MTTSLSTGCLNLVRNASFSELDKIEIEALRRKLKEPVNQKLLDRYKEKLEKRIDVWSTDSYWEKKEHFINSPENSDTILEPEERLVFQLFIFCHKENKVFCSKKEEIEKAIQILTAREYHDFLFTIVHNFPPCISAVVLMQYHPPQFIEDIVKELFNERPHQGNWQKFLYDLSEEIVLNSDPLQGDETVFNALFACIGEEKLKEFFSGLTTKREELYGHFSDHLKDKITLYLKKAKTIEKENKRPLFQSSLEKGEQIGKTIFPAVSLFHSSSSINKGKGQAPIILPLVELAKRELQQEELQQELFLSELSGLLNSMSELELEEAKRRLTPLINKIVAGKEWIEKVFTRTHALHWPKLLFYFQDTCKNYRPEEGGEKLRWAGTKAGVLIHLFGNMTIQEEEILPLWESINLCGMDDGTIGLFFCNAEKDKIIPVLGLLKSSKSFEELASMILIGLETVKNKTDFISEALLTYQLKKRYSHFFCEKIVDYLCKQLFRQEDGVNFIHKWLKGNELKYFSSDSFDQTYAIRLLKKFLNRTDYYKIISNWISLTVKSRKEEQQKKVILRKIVQCCLKNNLKIVFLSTPQTNEMIRKLFIEKSDKNNQKGEYIETDVTILLWSLKDEPLIKVLISWLSNRCREENFLINYIFNLLKTVETYNLEKKFLRALNDNEPLKTVLGAKLSTQIAPCFEEGAYYKIARLATIYVADWHKLVWLLVETKIAEANKEMNVSALLPNYDKIYPILAVLKKIRRLEEWFKFEEPSVRLSTKGIVAWYIKSKFDLELQ